MDFVSFLKKINHTVPYPVGALIQSTRPERLGKVGQVYRYALSQIQQNNIKELSLFAEEYLEKVEKILSFAKNNVQFYHLYPPTILDRISLREGLLELPIVNKRKLQNVVLLDRTSSRQGRFLANTGGSSGTPLEFYVNSDSVGHELAHIHHIWSTVGFTPGDLTLSFGGSHQKESPILYDWARHRYTVDTYHGWKTISESVRNIFRTKPIKFLHGYPSAIFDFVRWCADRDPATLADLSRNVSGLLLGSEYPNPANRSEAE